MGETGSAQGNIATSQGNPSGGQAQTSGQGTTTSTDTYTKTQVQEMLRKAQSDAQTEIGRAVRDGIKQATKGITDKYQEMMNQQASDFEALLEDKPNEISVLKEKQKSRQRESHLAQMQADLEAANARITEFEGKEKEGQKLTLAQEVASTFGVDSAVLTRLAKRTDGSREEIEDIAKDLPKQNPNNQGSGRPDLNQSRGGGGAKTPTFEELRNSTPEETEKKVVSGEWVIPGWK